MFHIFDKIKNGEVYIIAEMSANHAGKLENALAIVQQAAAAGADCVKIQTYTADTLTLDCEKEDFMVRGGIWDGYKLYDLYTEAATPWEWHEEIKKECEKCGVDFLSTPFDNSAVDFLETLGVEAYKVASYELIDIPLIKYIAKKHKPILLSCGMGNEEEIKEAIDACRQEGNNDIILLKCCSEYPANEEDMNLSLIPIMKKKFGVNIGLSDHSEGDRIDQLAVAAGACVIEKHVCINRGIENPDSEFSMEMEDFAKMVKNVRDTKKILGEGTFELSEREKQGMTGRRSLYAIKDIKKGEKFTQENIKSIRPSYGLLPKFYNQVLGNEATCNIERGTALQWEMIKKN